MFSKAISGGLKLTKEKNDKLITIRMNEGLPGGPGADLPTAGGWGSTLVRELYPKCYN